MRTNCCTACFYCDAALSVRHEHDHMPLPLRHGGEQTVPICINCHDLKDRMPLESWSGDQLVQGFQSMNPMGRLLLAKVYALSLDMTAEREARCMTAASP